MRLALRALALFVAFVTLAACCSVPEPPIVERVRVIDQGYDVVWKGAVRYASTCGVPVAAIEKDSGLIVFQSFRHGDEDAQVHCLPFTGVTTDRSTNGNILVQAEEDGSGTQVRVTMDYRVQIRVGGGGISWPYRYEWIPGVPSGTLERAMLDGISDAVGHVGASE